MTQLRTVRTSARRPIVSTLRSDSLYGCR